MLSNDPHSRQKTPITGSTNETTGILNVVLFYAVFSAIYILVSDWLVQSIFQDPELITKVSIAKGWGFVLITSASLYTLIRRLLRQSMSSLRLVKKPIVNSLKIALPSFTKPTLMILAKPPTLVLVSTPLDTLQRNG